MTKRNLKYIVFLVVVILLLFVCSMGIVLLLKKDAPKVNEKDVSYVADSNTIIIKSIISVSEEFGKKIDEENGGAFGYLHFDVVNNSDQERTYQIYVTKLNTNPKEINSNYVTMYLTDKNNKALSGFTGNQLPSFNNLAYIDNKPDSKELYTDTIKANGKKSFILRVWLAENYVVSDEDDSFSFEINARAI